MEKRKHHYIPKFYLELFVDNVESTQSPFLWVFERGQGCPKKRAPKNVAWKTGFYDIATDGPSERQSIEDLLSKVESKTAPLLRTMMTGDLSISASLKETLSLFLAFMLLRTPKFRASVNTFVDELSRKILLTAAYDREYFHDTYMNISQQAQLNVPEEELRDFIRGETYSIDVPKDMSIHSMIESAPTVSEVLRSMHWMILTAPSMVYFVTSDNPVVRYHPNPHSFFGGGLMDRNVEITFPLNPGACLFLSWRKTTSKSRTIRADRVREIDRALRFVFSSRSRVQDGRYDTNQLGSRDR